MLNDVMRRALTVRVGGEPVAAPGLRHFTGEADGRPVRYHLRVDPDGAGLVVVNASAACRLSPSGVLVAAELLGGAADEAVVRRLLATFRGVDGARAAADVARVREALRRMTREGGCGPLVSLDESGATARRHALSAPLGADLWVEAEVPAERLRLLWDAGVPHAVFALAPGASAEPLVAAVERAEDLGLVAGVRARATDLTGDGLLERLAAAGLDHLDLGWAGSEAGVHDALFGKGDFDRALRLVESSRALELFVSAVIPLTAPWAYDLDDEVASLAAAGVRAAAVWAVAVDADEGTDGAVPRRALRQVATIAEEAADRRGLAVTWCAPVERDPARTLAEQVCRGPRVVGEATVRVEADGAVVPPVGPPGSAGRLGVDAWASIWGHEAFRAWREETADLPRCGTCPGLAVCRDGCPAEPATWARRGPEVAR